MWYLIVSIPDLCTLTYLEKHGRSYMSAEALFNLLNVLGGKKIKCEFDKLLFKLAFIHNEIDRFN